MEHSNIEIAKTPQQIAEIIQRKRLFILVHSCIYYGLNDNLVSDAKWSQCGKQLAELQNRYPEVARTVEYAKDFEGFDGSTGCDLPFRDPQILNKACWLLKTFKGGFDNERKR